MKCRRSTLELVTVSTSGPDAECCSYGKIFHKTGKQRITILLMAIIFKSRLHGRNTGRTDLLFARLHSFRLIPLPSEG
ncbi:hypothetical protein GN956_G18659 [Arapaima gigas]